MQGKIEEYLSYYIGCNTNKGKLIGINQQRVFTQLPGGDILEHDTTHAGFVIKPFLRRLSNLSIDESSQLIKKGFSIGRPNGYSFSPDAFLFLLSLHVDLFGLIESGLAIEMTSREKNEL